MASATTILAQSIPCLLNAFPGWKQPVHVHIRATIGGSGVATVVSDGDATTGDAGTTPGVSIARQAAGIYDVTFPPCRQAAWGSLVGNVFTASGGFAVAAEYRPMAVDKTDANTSAPLGKLRVGFYTNAGGVPTELLTGAEIHLSFWADLG